MPKRTKDKINCETCRNFTGEAFVHRFGCAKGHEREEAWSFKRTACPDNSQMMREELILKRFVQGDEAIQSEADRLKSLQTSTRRTVGALTDLSAKFGRFLDHDQVQAIEAAAKALQGLGNDIADAAKIAKRQAAERQRRLERATAGAQSAVAATPELNPPDIKGRLTVALFGAMERCYSVASLQKRLLEACQPPAPKPAWDRSVSHTIEWYVNDEWQDTLRELVNDISYTSATTRRPVAEVLAEKVSAFVAKRAALHADNAALLVKVDEVAKAQAFVAQVGKPMQG